MFEIEFMKEVLKNMEELLNKTDKITKILEKYLEKE